MLIMGIDPGTATTGYGIIEIKNKAYRCIEYGTIKTSKETKQEERLKIINTKVNDLLKEYQPQALAVETIYFFKNSKTAIPVSHARGVVLMAAAEQSIPVYEFTPLQAKSATVGHGRASKKQVQEMVKLLLSLDEIPRPNDAADALAIAICCARMQNKI